MKDVDYVGQRYGTHLKNTVRIMDIYGGIW